jgi:pseudouridine-5'-phosphate glycosidase
VCTPVPEDAALPLEVARHAIRRATEESGRAGIHGPELTPWVLARVAELTEGASVRANTALIENDARVAGRISVALAAASTVTRA